MWKEQFPVAQSPQMNLINFISINEIPSNNFKFLSKQSTAYHKKPFLTLLCPCSGKYFLFIVYLVFIHRMVDSHCAASPVKCDRKMVLNGEYLRIWKERVMSYFMLLEMLWNIMKALSQ